MFDIFCTPEEKMRAATQKCFRDIQGIDEVVKLQKRVSQNPSNDIDFCDAEIEGFEFSPTHDRLTVYIAYAIEDETAHYVFDFFDPEILYCDFEYTNHWIDDVTIRRNADNKYTISFGSAECDFRYSHARVNRCWID